jgi:hypothetical protein
MLSAGSRARRMYIIMVIYQSVYVVTCCEARESLNWTTHTPPGEFTSPGPGLARPGRVDKPE